MELDDEPMVRRVVARILMPLGYTVLQASSAPEALEVLAAHPGPVHLLLVDLLLSIRHGPQLRRAIWAQRPGIRMLFLSAYSDSGDENFLAKPFLPHTLVAKVHKLLEGEVTLGSAPLPSQGMEE
jgi:two-component system cell cycle sensor histidine kinase/response regulator CckA